MSDTGNTIGRLAGVPPMAGAPMWAANHPIVVETPEEAAWLAKLHAGPDGSGAIPEVSAVFDESNALIYADAASTAAYLSGQDATQAAGQAAKPWRGEDGAKVLGSGGPAVCLECMMHAAETGAIGLERR